MNEEKGKENLILIYKKLKEDLDKERHSETLNKFLILNRAYDLGIKIYGRNSFSIMKLSLDFEMPYTTTKRILSLRKANKRTWKLINEEKITSFKASMILLKKSITFQDEIIDLVIKDNLSTFQIRSLNIKDLKDIQKERLRVAVERGFGRASTCYYSFSSTLDRLEQLFLLNDTDLPKHRLPELRTKLIRLDRNLDKFLRKLNKLWKKK